jgi:hypothetical protein
VTAEELHAAGVVGGHQLRQEQASKQPRQHAYGQEEAGVLPPLSGRHRRNPQSLAGISYLS